MSHKHKKSRRENYGIRAHELYERPRTIDPASSIRIGPFGEGIIHPQTPQNPDAVRTIRPNPSGESFTPRPGDPEKR